jgi:carboxyl-terminal processing protease
MSAWTTRAGAIAVLLGLWACAAEQEHPAENASAQLYARGLDEITQLYLRPESARRLVVAAAAQLSTLDPAVTAAAGPGSGSQSTLVVSYDRRTIGSFWMPDGHDTAALGATLASAVATAKQASPHLAGQPQEAIDKAIFDGMTGMLDRFSRYSPPEVAREHRAARNGFGGIGITLDTSNDDFRITAVTPHGPAERAGIRPGDRVVAIDHIATAGHTRAEVTHRLRGPVGSKISVTVGRQEPPETREFEFLRALVTLPTVTVEEHGDIAVIRVAGFNHSTTEDVHEIVAKALKRGNRLRGVILDLRGNPGGLLEQAVGLAELFVARGPIVSTTGRHPASHQYFAASGNSPASQVPVVVLVNGGSASASEIVAASLQDLGRAVVVGSSSFGKGTVQTVMRLPNDGELTLTWAALVTPSGYLLQAHGVVPTICTADLADDAGAVDLALARATGSAAVPAVRRASLDPRGWQALRASCPARHTSPALDLKVAERLIVDPALYAQALRPLAAVTTLANAGAADLLAGPSLTDPRAALSSRTRPN